MTVTQNLRAWMHAYLKSPGALCCGLLVLLCPMQSQAATPPKNLSMRLLGPKPVKPAQRTTFVIAWTNATKVPILPLSVTLSRGKKALRTWKHAWWRASYGTIHKGRFYAFVQRPTQRVRLRPPVARLSLKASAKHKLTWRHSFVRIRPLLPGQRFSLTHSLSPSYQDEGVYTATLRTIRITDLKTLCAVTLPSNFTERLYPCLPIKQLKAPGFLLRLHAPKALRKQKSHTQQASIRLQLLRPAFPLPEARAKAGLPKGPYAYDAKRRRWILTDPQHKRTLLVPQVGAVQTLRGNWMAVFQELLQNKSASLYWNTSSPKEAKSLRETLNQHGWSAFFFAFKGGRSQTRLGFRIKHEDIPTLSRLVLRKKAKLRGTNISSKKP